MRFILHLGAAANEAAQKTIANGECRVQCIDGLTSTGTWESIHFTLKEVVTFSRDDIYGSLAVGDVLKTHDSENIQSYPIAWSGFWTNSVDGTADQSLGDLATGAARSVESIPVPNYLESLFSWMTGAISSEQERSV